MIQGIQPHLFNCKAHFLPRVYEHVRMGQKLYVAPKAETFSVTASQPDDPDMLWGYAGHSASGGEEVCVISILPTSPYPMPLVLASAYIADKSKYSKLGKARTFLYNLCCSIAYDRCIGTETPKPYGIPYSYEPCIARFHDFLLRLKTE